MKDKEQNFRGGCLSCSCPEYELNPSSNKCQDCNCSVTRHKLLNLTKVDGAGPRAPLFKTPGPVMFSFLGFLIWVAASSYLVYLKSFGFVRNASLKESRGVGDSSYYYGAAASLFAMSFTMIYFNSQNPDRRAIAGVMFHLLFMYFGTYVLMITRATPTWIGNGGHVTDPIRYVEWFIAMPAMLYLFARITRFRFRLSRNIFLITLQTAFALLSQVMRDPFAEWALIASWLSFLPVSYDMWIMFEDAIRGKTKSTLDKTSLRFIHIDVQLTWFGFGVVYCLIRSQLVSYGMGEALYTCCDIMAKVYLTMLMLNASSDSSNVSFQKNDQKGNVTFADNKMEMVN